MVEGTERIKADGKNKIIIYKKRIISIFQNLYYLKTVIKHFELQKFNQYIRK